MEDRQTGSVWTHYDGQVLTGPLAGTGVELEIQPMVHTTWGDWVQQYPTSEVLDWYDEYSSNYREVKPGRGGIGPQFQATILNWDDRLEENELVLGVDTGTAARAYVIAEFPVERSVIADEIDGKPIVVFTDGGPGFALAYSPVVDDAHLVFSATPGGWMSNDGTVWDGAGVAVSGPLAGRRLDFVTSFVTEWYGWAAYHPDTSIYETT